MNKIGLRFGLFLLLAGFFFGGCAKTSSITSEVMPTDQDRSESIFVYSDGYIKQVSSLDGTVIASTPITSAQAPSSFSIIDTFKVSESTKFVVWFSPLSGVYALNTITSEISLVYTPSKWFFDNPYFQFYGDTETLVLIDEAGSEMVWINLEERETEKRPVPFPFGTVFSISPDLEKIVFVEGYGKTKIVPVYLVTNKQGELITTFNSTAEISDRNLITWSNDSQSIIVVEKSNQLVLYSLETPLKPTVLYEVSTNERILRLERYQDLLFFKTDQYLYLFNQKSQEVVRRLPVESLKPLSNPVLKILNETHFLIEEDVKAFDNTHKRLWIGDWLSTKKILIPDYGFYITAD